jgi:hypothetical protein
MTHHAILKAQEHHDDPGDLTPAQQVLATAVSTITWARVRDIQTANWVYGNMARGDYRAALTRADQKCNAALDLALERYEQSLEDQDEVLEIEAAVAQAMTLERIA